MPMKTKNTQISELEDSVLKRRFSRKRFLQLGATTAAAVSMGGMMSGCELAPRGRGLIFANLNEALVELDRIENNPPVEMQQEWTLYKVLNHTAQSMEYSMTGYPQMDPPFVQSIAKLVFNNFKANGFMRHDLGDPVPGAPEIPDEGYLPEAFQRLRNAISDFQNWTGALFPHFKYGELSYEDWEIAHSMHLADHFSSLTYNMDTV